MDVKRKIFRFYNELDKHCCRFFNSKFLPDIVEGKLERKNVSLWDVNACIAKAAEKSDFELTYRMYPYRVYIARWLEPRLNSFGIDLIFEDHYRWWKAKNNEVALAFPIRRKKSDIWVWAVFYYPKGVEV